MNLIQSNIKTMSSREIAELTKKEHSNIKRDISAMILQLNYPYLMLKDCPDFNPSELKGHNVTIKPFTHNGNMYEEFQLDQDMSLLLATGYSVTLRQTLIKRWRELEQSQAPVIPQTYAAALLEAGRLAGIVEEQGEQLAIAAPKVAFVDNYVASTGNKGFRQVCKLLKVKEPEFREFLEGKKIMYKLAGEWSAYQNHIDAGRFYVTTGSFKAHAYTDSKFTPKGVEWIAGLWAIDKIKNT